MAGGISADSEQLIHRCIHSVEQLEILLLLRREAARRWSAADVARELRIDPASAALRLEDLAQHALVEGDAQRGHAFSAATTPLARNVDALARDYSERRHAVIAAIFSRPNDALQSFADAFRIRGKR